MWFFSYSLFFYSYLTLFFSLFFIVHIIIFLSFVSFQGGGGDSGRVHSNIILAFKSEIVWTNHFEVSDDFVHSPN